MAMQTYDFAYGRGRKTFTVEEDRVLKVVRTEEFPPMEDIRAACSRRSATRSAARRSKRSSSPATPSLHLQRPDPRRQQLRLHARARR